jgi:hypothetical protein
VHCCAHCALIFSSYKQEWNWDKKLERSLKVWFLRKDAAGLSAVEPRTYKLRFMERMRNILNLTAVGEESESLLVNEIDCPLLFSILF